MRHLTVPSYLTIEIDSMAAYGTFSLLISIDWNRANEVTGNKYVEAPADPLVDNRSHVGGDYVFYQYLVF